ncbi:MAG TPA: YIP1 family protein [Longimicrobiales bacterium]
MTGSVLPPSNVEAPPGANASTTFPWPPASGAEAPGAFFRTWWDSITRPADFFRCMPESAGTGPALLYYYIVGIILAVVELFWGLAFALTISAVAYLASLFETLDLEPDAFSPIIEFLLAPAELSLKLLLAFAVIHAMLVVVGGPRRDAGTTLRVLCYAYGARAFSIVPVIGDLVGTVWMVAAAIIGLREAHRTDGWRAALAVLLPVAAAIALGLALLVLLAVIVGLRFR